MELTEAQLDQIRKWRREAIDNGHLLDDARLRDIEKEVESWGIIPPLGTSSFRELFALCRSNGAPTGVETWRGLCHWLWLRHRCVHCLCFTPAKLAVMQRRAGWVEDSPGYLDMTTAGHVGAKTPEEALRDEGFGEAGLRLEPGSPHVAVAAEDLKPIRVYNYVEPPRPRKPFYNAEVRYVYAVRLTPQGMGDLQPKDKEVEAFILAQLADAYDMLRGKKVASALRISGPHALYHAVTQWGWEP